MPVDPQIQALLDLFASMQRPAMSQGTPAQAREAFTMLTVGARQPAFVVPVKETSDIVFPGPAGDMKARVYRPDASGPLPTVVFFHGGGFVIGDVDTHDNQARLICRDASAVVLSVDYRLAPEAPWPAAVEDCVDATRWAAEHVDTLGGDADRLAVAGDSAGGNLAAVVCQQLKDTGPRIAAQLLLYPAVDFSAEEGTYPSRESYAEGYFLTADDMRWFGEQYAPEAAHHGDPRLSPLRAPDLSGLPPAVIATAEFDPLSDEGKAYAAALEKAGVPVVLHHFDGLIHGFFDLGPLSPAAAAAVSTSTAALRDLLHS